MGCSRVANEQGEEKTEWETRVLALAVISIGRGSVGRGRVVSKGSIICCVLKRPIQKLCYISTTSINLS